MSRSLSIHVDIHPLSPDCELAAGHPELFFIFVTRGIAHLRSAASCLSTALSLAAKFCFSSWSIFSIQYLARLYPTVFLVAGFILPVLS
jgi:hypothetical protein